MRRGGRPGIHCLFVEYKRCKHGKQYEPRPSRYAIGEKLKNILGRVQCACNNTKDKADYNTQNAQTLE